MVREPNSHPLPVRRSTRSINRSFRLFMIFSFACLCLTLSSCYPWLHPTTKGPSIKLQIIAGSTKTIVLHDVDNAGDLKGVDFSIFGVRQRGPLSGNFRVTSSQIGDKTLQMTFETDAKTPEDIYKGWLPLRYGLGQEGIISPITIHVIKPSDDFIPRGATIPSTDRIVRDKDGQLVVKDELIVMMPIFAPSAIDPVVASNSRKRSIKGAGVVDKPIVICPQGNQSPLWIPSLTNVMPGSFVASRSLHSVTAGEGGFFITPEDSDIDPPATESPIIIVPEDGTAERAVCNITSKRVYVDGEEKPIGGEFIGSIPETRSFQMRFSDIHTLEDLAEKRRLILENFPEVSAVSRSVVAMGQPLTAPDQYHQNHLPEGDPNAVTNETLFETVKVHLAWDETTGHDHVRVAVIDCDFLTTHPDFHVNVRTATGAQSRCQDHGTRTAGIIAAVSSSGAGSGIAGLAWNTKMRLYDILNGSGEFRAETYPARFANEIALPTVEAMVAAITDDLADDFIADESRTVPRANRTLVTVVNRSYHQSNLLSPANPDPVVALVDETNAILNQGILFALKSNKEVLWVFPAGNEDNDARLQSPASLSWWYPLDTITVANANVTGPTFTLAENSNHGPLVAVGAPGYELASTDEDNSGSADHEPFGGTSAAAPFVAGLAALILSQMEEYIEAGDITDDWPAWKVRQCITAGADGDISGHGFNLINAQRALPRPVGGGYDCDPVASTPDLPANRNIDIVFAFDTTGSMSREIGEVKRHADAILEKLKNAFDTANPSPANVKLRFAVISYEDYPGSFDSSANAAGAACPDPISDYSDDYGRASSGDAPYRVHLMFDESLSNVKTAIVDLETRSGADGPESYGRVFWQIAMASEQAAIEAPDPDYRIGFSEDSLKIIINLGDNFPHDNDLNGEDLNSAECTGTNPDAGICKYDILNPTFNGAFPLLGDLSEDTGIDPGPNGDLECGDGDDIDFQEDALTKLEEQKIRLLHIDSSGKKAIYAPYWSTWTRGTKGAYVPIDSDGSVPNGIDLPGLILSFVRHIASTDDE